MIDPVTVQIFRNRIGCLMDEMSHHFFRSGYSTIVRESRDFSCMIVDAQGRFLVSPPMFYHTTAIYHLVRRLTEIYGSDGLGDGDLFVCNHPYEGAVPHASDVTVIAPIVADGIRIGFSASIAHKADIGGTVPGSSFGQATEMFQEGLLLPPMRLRTAGVPNPDIERLIAANSRQPETVLGDLRSQIGAVGIGRDRMKALAAEHGAATVRDAIAQMIEASGREIRAALKRLPDGTSEAEGFLDGDGNAVDKPVRMHARVTVANGVVTFDFTDADPQRKGPVNLRPALVESCCYYVLIGLIDPTLRFSDSARDSIRILSTPGTVLHAVPPAPCSSYMKSCQKLIDVLIEALNPFCPARAAASAGGSGGSATIAWGEGPRKVDGNQHEIFGSAYGGANGQDGASGTTVHLSNIYITPIEIVETEYPCRIRRFELIPGSGGDGEFRGGLSFRREYELLQPATVMYRGDKAVFGPKGYAGGADGRTSRFLVNPDGADEKILPAVCRVDLKAGDRFRVEAAGGGGYGDPKKRRPEARRQDAEDGYSARDEERHAAVSPDGRPVLT